MIQIARATENDVERCLEVRHAAFAHAAPSAYSAEQVAALLARDERPVMTAMIADGQLFVALDEGMIVGCGGWRHVNVHNLYVHPTAMRRGVGRMLLAAIEQQFAVKGREPVLRIDAGVYTLPFYEACGYELLDTVISSDGLAYLEMRKHVRPLERPVGSGVGY